MKYNNRFFGKRSSIRDFEDHKKLSPLARLIFERMTNSSELEVYQLSDLCRIRDPFKKRVIEFHLHLRMLS